MSIDLEVVCINKTCMKYCMKGWRDVLHKGIVQSIMYGRETFKSHIKLDDLLFTGQSVYQLLPPPYRDVWLEWADAEKQAAQQEQLQENKVPNKEKNVGKWRYQIKKKL